MKRFRIFTLLCWLLLFYVQISAGQEFGPGGPGGPKKVRIYRSGGPFGYGGAAASSAAAASGGGGAAAASAAAASGGGGAAASSAAAAAGGGGGGIDFKGKAVKAIAEAKAFNEKMKGKMAELHTKAIAKFAEMKAAGPEGLKLKMKEMGGKIMDHFQKEGIFNKDKAIEYIKNIDMDHIHKVIDECGIKEHFKDFDIKGWIKESGIGDKMKEFFGDDCDIHAVADKKWKKIKTGAKSFVKQIPVYLKTMKEKAKAKAAAGAVAGGKGGKAKSAAGAVAGGKGGKAKAIAGAVAGGKGGKRKGGGGGGAAAAAGAAAGGGGGGGAAAAASAAAAA